MDIYRLSFVICHLFNGFLVRRVAVCFEASEASCGKFAWLDISSDTKRSATILRIRIMDFRIQVSKRHSSMWKFYSLRGPSRVVVGGQELDLGRPRGPQLFRLTSFCCARGFHGQTCATYCISLLVQIMRWRTLYPGLIPQTTSGIFCVRRSELRNLGGPTYLMKGRINASLGRVTRVQTP